MGVLCALLGAAALGLAAVCLWQRRRVRRLAARLEDFLTHGGAPLEFSVREDGFAPLINAAAELEHRLLLSREREKAECRRAGALTTDISHQLKTPLAALRLFCEMDGGEHMAGELSQIERMERLIYALLRLERLCADGYAFHFAEADVEEIVREAWDSLKRVFPDRELTIEGNARLRCDRKWLGEAYMNLLKNACEHTKPGGQIWVRLDQTSRTFFCDVEDDGGGVRPEELSRLFERFYRAQGQESEGAGVGLAIVREIVRRHHGDIYAENGEKGLRMRISLPLYSLAG